MPLSPSRTWSIFLALAVLLGLAGPAIDLKAQDLLVEDFQSPAAHGAWMVNQDNNHLGTVIEPVPFAPSEGGSPGSSRGCARIHGRLGLNQAPWTWAQLQLDLAPSGAAMDMSRYKSVHFWVKGDGKIHQIRLLKKSVKNSDHFGMSFLATPEWTLVKLPLAGFKQAGWGAVVPQAFDDVFAVEFNPLTHDADFDFSVDAVAFSEDAVVLQPRAYASQDWWTYAGVDPDARQGGILDMGFLQDAPAGRHGRLQAKGEDFAFSDGRPVRFFGVNLVASSNFPTHAQADAMAELLSEMGVNITRHHHMEAPWSDRNIFGKAAGTRVLDAESMDRFDYLVAALQKKGIYQYFDLLVSREPLAADGVKDAANLVNGYKLEAEFAPDLLALQKGFITQFLGHVNKYTGRRYAKDPAVAMMEVINEDSQFYRGGDGDFALKGAVYPKVLQESFNRWLRAHYPSAKALAAAWSGAPSARTGLAADENPWSSTVRPLASWQDDSWRALSPARALDEARFTYATQTRYYAEIIDYLRGLGYQGLVTGSNHWTEFPADLLANARLGTFIDRHAYYAHPQGGWGYNPDVTFDPSAMLRTQGLGIVSELAARRVKGLPYISTEWQCAAPNDYRADAVLDMAAACDLQGWSAIQFAFLHSSQGDLSHFSGPLDNNFNVANQPAMLALWPAAAILARRGDVDKLGLKDWTYLTDSEAVKPGAKLGAPGSMALMAECGMAFEPAPAQSPRVPVLADGWTSADAGQVRHSAERGLLLIDAPGTQAVAGFSRGVQAHPSRLQVALKNDYAVVVATAMDTADLGSAKKILLTAAANAINEGMTLEPSGDQLASKGGDKVLVEPVVGTVSLFLRGVKTARAWALDPSGRRQGSVSIAKIKGGLQMRLRAQDQAMHYEIELTRVGD